ncbi:MAG TPA: isochorismate synthase [Burkholderiales bacterium]|nr:isochorismate synthase [Burkholderiales bacterium]
MRATLMRRLAEALGVACRDCGPGAALLSVTVAADGLSFPGLPAGVGPVTYWARPGSGLRLLGSGRAACVEARGPERFAELERGFGELRAGWRHFDADGSGARPLALGGFAFDPQQHPAHAGALPNSELVVPELLLAQRGGRVTLTATVNPSQQRLAAAVQGRLAAAEALLQSLARPPAPAAAPSLARREAIPADRDWIARVQAARAAMAGGRLRKVVLTRRLSVAAHRALDPACVLALLAERYPDCVLFAHGAGESGMWLGATPETLVRLRGDTVSSDALAGTAERGADPAADRRIADALLASPKLALEHSLVVEAIVEALRGLCVTVEAPPRPRVMALRDIQHLWTPVRARVKPGASLFGLLARLHPTPAVGGTPGPAALDWLAAAGEARSGWYTGGMGWVDREGDGEFAVVLRCALLRGTHAELFAGAGIVPDSDPARELEETEMKFGAMLEALGGARALRSLDAERRG